MTRKLSSVVLLTFLFWFNKQCEAGGYPLEQFFDFGAEHGDRVLQAPTAVEAGDLDLSIALPFFNKTETKIYVSMRGVISFQRVVAEHTRCNELMDANSRMIAPFWTHADLTNDTDGLGKLMYRQDTNPRLLEKAAKEIKAAFPHLWWVNVKWLFIATWLDITYYLAPVCSKPWPRNTFQAVIASNGLTTFTIFNYNSITWTTGTVMCHLGNDCSGLAGSKGTPAKVGFDAGDSKHFQSPPWSCTDDVIEIEEDSNVGVVGKFIYRIDSDPEDGRDLFALCSNVTEPGNQDDLTVKPTFVDSQGGSLLALQGPCLDKQSKIACIFTDLAKGNITVQGQALVQEGKVPTALCTVPFFHETGRTHVYLLINDLHYYKGALTVVTTDYPRFLAQFVNVTAKPTALAEAIDFTWDPALFDVVNVTVDISMLLLELTDAKTYRTWKKNATIATGLSNDGKYRKMITEILDKKQRDKIPPASLIMFTLEPKIILPNRFDPAYEAPLSYVASGRLAAGYLNYDARRAGGDCKEWHSFESNPRYNGYGPVNVLELTPCPPTLSLAQRDPNFEIDRFTDSMYLLGLVDAKQALNFFHPGATHAYRARVPSAKGNVQQCTYRKNPGESDGKLLYGFPSGGTADRIAPVSLNSSEYHYDYDITMFVACCVLSPFCDRFYYLRPSDDGTRYVPPQPALGAGDPHFTTLDRFSYTFNGAGEFWMIKPRSEKQETRIKLQARMTEFFSPTDGSPTHASVFSAFAMQDGNGPVVQVVISQGDQVNIVLVDGSTLDFNSATASTQYFEGFTIDSLKDDVSELIVSFANGYSFVISSGQGSMAITSTLTKQHMNQVYGLLGNFDGNPDNDLQSRNGSSLSPYSDLPEIHYNFGMSWIVFKNESIFVYGEGESYEAFAKPDFTPSFIMPTDDSFTPEQAQIAKETCGNSRTCRYDYFATGFNKDFAKQSVTQELNFNETVQIIEQEVKLCPAIAFANGVINTGGLGFFEGTEAAFSCFEGYELDGASLLRCGGDGRWSDDAPVCRELYDGLEWWAILLIVLAVLVILGLVGVLFLYWFMVIRAGYNEKESSNNEQKKDEEHQMENRGQRSASASEASDDYAAVNEGPAKSIPESDSDTDYGNMPKDVNGNV